MKKITYTITLLAFAFFFIGCEKEAMIEQSVVQESEMIPIAKITAQNEIQHLFLQKDMQESFKDSPEIELVFMEVVDNNKKGENAGLLYRIYNREQGVTTTTLMTSVLTLKGDIYYYDPLETCTSTISCSTSNTRCKKTEGACFPSGTTCTDCPWNGGKCITRIAVPAPAVLMTITKTIRAAVAVY